MSFEIQHSEQEIQSYQNFKRLSGRMCEFNTKHVMGKRKINLIFILVQAWILKIQKSNKKWIAKDSLMGIWTENFVVDGFSLCISNKRAENIMKQ